MIGIYFIATGPYKVQIEGFLDSIVNFRPNYNKHVVLITDDDGNYYRNYLTIEHHHIEDAPWPIITLLKMWYISKYKVECDEVYYFNANARVFKDIPSCNNEIILTNHPCSESCNIDNLGFLKLEDDNPNSLSYIGLIPYTYVSAAFFGGDSKLVYEMCDTISQWVEDDLCRGVIPKWHDESYLNKYCLLNKHLCNISKIIGRNCSVYYVDNKEFKPKRKY